MFRNLFFCCLLGGTGLAASNAADATVVGYTDKAAFDLELSAGFTQTVLDFESAAAGDLIASGGTLGGIGFSYPGLAAAGVSLAVSDGAAFDATTGTFSTTSGANFLGSNDADILLDGDDLELTFGPVNALGLFFLTVDPVIDGDVRLSVAGGFVSLVSAQVVDTLADGSAVYFLGLIDFMTPFSSAQLTTGHDGAGGFFAFNIDDIVTATPRTGGTPVQSPSTFILAFSAMLWLARRQVVKGKRLNV